MSAVHHAFAPAAPAPAPSTAVPAKPPRRWRLARNCCLGPGRLLALAAAPSLLALLASLPLLWLGYPAVTAIALLYGLLAGVALLLYARHATDGEWLLLDAGRLRLTQRSGGHTTSHAWDARSVRVHRPAPQHLLTLCAGGRTYTLGEHLTPAERERVAHQLRMALAVERGDGDRVVDLPQPAATAARAVAARSARSCR